MLYSLTVSFHPHPLSAGFFPVLSLMVDAVAIGPVTDPEGLSDDHKRVPVASSVTFLMGTFLIDCELCK